jgi:hypothetical protein
MYGVVKAVLVHLEIKHTDEQVHNLLPCKATVENYLKILSMKNIFIGAARLEEEGGVGVYLGTDKADDKIKKGMIKVVSKFLPSLATDNFPDGQVFTMILDSDATGSKTSEGAEGTINSWHKLPNHDILFLSGVYSDSGGGFVIEGKKAALVDGKICHWYALVANCTLHNIQLVGTVPMQTIMGDGAVGKRNVKQLLYLAYNVQTEMGRRMTRELLKECEERRENEEMDEEGVEPLDADSLIEWFKDLAEKKQDLLQMKPDDARWWYTAVAAVRLARNWLLWIALTDAYLEKKNLTPVQRDIAGNLKSMLTEPEILCDLYLLACFFRGFLFHHFKFFQGVDPNIGKPGFLSFHILTRVFLMTRDLERLSKYQTVSDEEEHGMKPFIAAVSQLQSEADRQRQHWKATKFLKIAKDEMYKMFRRWIDPRLFFLGAFSESPTGRLIARFCLSEVNDSRLLLKEGEATSFESKLHGSGNDSKTIDLSDFADWLLETGGMYEEEIRLSHHVMKHKPALEKIASGLDIWNQQDAAAKPVRRCILIDYGGLPSVTQHLERGNKNHNLCSSNGRKERAIASRMNA